MNEALIKMLKYLRLGGLLDNWDRYLELAGKGNYSHGRLLEHVILQEYQIKKENARKMRIRKARIPEHFVLETYPFNRQPKLNKKRIESMYDAFDYMTKCRSIIFIGPTGTGKTGLATAFLTHAINQGITACLSLSLIWWSVFINRLRIILKQRPSKNFFPTIVC